MIIKLLRMVCHTISVDAARLRLSTLHYDVTSTWHHAIVRSVRRRMSKVTFIISITLNAILMLNTKPLHTMLSNDMKYPNPIYSNEYQTYLHSNFKVRTQKAEEYNQCNNTLITLPSDILHEIFFHIRHNVSLQILPYPLRLSAIAAKDDYDEEALEKSIKTFMKIRLTCNAMYRFLTPETIANFCKNYTHEIKLNLFKNLMRITSTPGDEIKHFPAIIVLCTGIDTTHVQIQNGLERLLTEAVLCNNVQRAMTLFKHKADPNTQGYNAPLFFYAKTIEMIQVFVENKIDIHTISLWRDTNVLWEVIKTDYPSDLMKFYLTHNVNANILHPLDNSCLLHKLTWSSLDIDVNFFEKSRLLLEAIPDMINTFDNKEQTPLDLAYNALEKYQKKNINSVVLEAVIALFREHGGKTGQERMEEFAHLSSH